MFPLFEAEGGRVTAVTRIRNRRPVAEYLKLQRRFAHVFKTGNEHQLARLEAIAEGNIAEFDLLGEGKPS